MISAASAIRCSEPALICSKDGLAPFDGSQLIFECFLKLVPIFFSNFAVITIRTDRELHRADDAQLMSCSLDELADCDVGLNVHFFTILAAAAAVTIVNP